MPISARVSSSNASCRRRAGHDARPGQGKRGSYRTIIAYRVKKRAVFLFGFAKSRKANLDPDEQAELVKRGAVWLGASDAVIERAIARRELKEVNCGEEGQKQA